MKISQFNNRFHFQGFLWFECAAWSDFTKSLGLEGEETPVLYDMSGNFFFSITKSNGEYCLNWRALKADINGKRKTEINFSSILDDDEVSEIKRQFDNFPVWW